MMVDDVSYNDADIILNNELDPAMPEQIGLRALSRIIIINYCLHLFTSNFQSSDRSHIANFFFFIIF